MGYMKELRKIVGTRPLIMNGSCILVIDKQNRLLLQQRTDNGFWGLPGGSMELGETCEEVAYRELYEETGLQALSLELWGVFSGKDVYYRYPHGDEVFNVTVAYKCSNFKGVLKGDKTEVKELKFFNTWEIPEDINPPERPILNQFIKGLRT